MKQFVKKLMRKQDSSAAGPAGQPPAPGEPMPQKTAQELELERLLVLPRYTRTHTDLFGGRFELVDARSFYWSYKEIFEQQIYRFTAQTESPLIIDGGSNIGTSILYFKRNYPNAKVIAFEADPEVFRTLETNIRNFNLENVVAHNKALWNSEGAISFMCEGADGGRILSHLESFAEVNVQTVRLSNFLREPVDLLKLDIEGAEVDVLKDCAESLHTVNNIFIEFHSFQNQVQRLDELLALLTRAGFRYQIHTQFASPMPFLERTYQLGMDLQLNIFAYRV